MQKNADGSISELHTRTNESGIDLTSDDQIVHAWNSIRGRKSTTRWSLITYADRGMSSSNTDLIHLSSGNGGMTELITHLGESDVTYGVLLCRVGFVNKPMFITWVGPSVSSIYRGRVSMHKQGVKNY